MLARIPAVWFLLFCMTGVAAQTGNQADKDAMMEAFRSYHDLSAAGDFEASLADARRVMELSLKVFPENDRQVAAATVNYGHNLLRVGDKKKSLKILKIGLDRYEDLYGKNSPELIVVLLWMSEATITPPKFRPKQSYLDRAREIASSSFDHSSVEYANELYAIADASYFYPPAQSVGDDLLTAYQIFRKQLGPSAAMTGQTAYGLGIYHVRHDDFEAAEPYLLEALEIFDPSDANLWRSHADVRMFMWRTLQDRGMTEEATAQLLEIGKLQEIYPDEDKGLPISRVAPSYPASALKAGITGYVDLTFTVDEEGYVVDPEVVEFTGSEAFIPFAIRTVERFRYVPLFVDGQAAPRHDVQSRITFRIER